mmetsp:Transcript_50265/g.57686  ORF Transcript_50265/g.57686 Transcript_50265/m.57686 type:complete len:286 (-) Transcript_50265:129-986(-)
MGSVKDSAEDVEEESPLDPVLCAITPLNGDISISVYSEPDLEYDDFWINQFAALNTKKTFEGSEWHSKTHSVCGTCHNLSAYNRKKWTYHPCQTCGNFFCPYCDGSSPYNWAYIIHPKCFRRMPCTVRINRQYSDWKSSPPAWIHFVALFVLLVFATPFVIVCHLELNSLWKKVLVWIISLPLIPFGMLYYFGLVGLLAFNREGRWLQICTTLFFPVFMLIIGVVAASSYFRPRTSELVGVLGWIKFVFKCLLSFFVGLIISPIFFAYGHYYIVGSAVGLIDDDD